MGRRSGAQNLKSQEPSCTSDLSRPSRTIAPSASAACLGCGRNFLAAAALASLVFLSSGNALAQTLPEEMTRHNILHFMHDHRVATVEEFIEALPLFHKSQVSLIFTSAGLNKDHTSGEHPRVVSWGSNAFFIFAWGTNPVSPTRETVEFLRPVRDKWVAGAIDFSGSVPEIKEPKVCSTCHGRSIKPLWGDYPHWEGTELHDGNAPRSDELASLVAAMASTDPRLAPLDMTDKTGHPVSAQGHRALLPITYSPPFELNVQLARRHGEVLFHTIRERADYEGIAENVMCATNPENAVREYFSVGEHHPSLLMDETGMNPIGAVQGMDFDDIVQSEDVYQNHEYVFEGGNGVGDIFAFLILHDLYRQNSLVTDLYRSMVVTGRKPDLVSMETELLDIYCQNFGCRGQASFDARAADKIHIYRLGLHLADMTSPVCEVVTENRDQPSTPYAELQPMEVTSFTMVDAGDDQDIQEIQEGDAIDLAALSMDELTVRANVSGPPEAVSWVRLEITGAQFAVRDSRSDYLAPYTMYGDDGAGDYVGAPLSAGEYYVSATPYTHGGEAGPTPHYSVFHHIQTADRRWW